MDTKATDNKVIIYDDSCPMCVWYTGIFVKNNMLPPQGRMGFTQVAQSQLLTQLDLNRARHEIPLVDSSGGATLYGIDAMVYIIGNRFPVVKYLMAFKPLRACFLQLYHFISYNRRVIAGTAKAKQGIDCTPDLNLVYRTAYLAFAFVVSVAIGFGFVASILAYLPWAINNTAIWALIASIWLLALLPGILWMPDQKLDYFGNQATVLLIGSLILLPGLLVQVLFGPIGIFVPLGSAVLSFGLMVWEHLRRIKNMMK